MADVYPAYINPPPSARLTSSLRGDAASPAFLVAVQAPANVSADLTLNPTTIEEPIQRKSSRLLVCAILLRVVRILCYIAVLSIPRVYRSKFRHTADDRAHPVNLNLDERIRDGNLQRSRQNIFRETRLSGSAGDAEEGSVDPFDGMALHTSALCWEQAVSHLIKGWKTIQFGSGILIPCCFTVLQIEPVLDKIVMRTLILAAAILAIASLACSTSYTLCTSRWLQRCLFMQWLYASCPGAELDFWNFLSLPAIFFSWSLIIFFVTITLLSMGNSIDSESPNSADSFLPSLVSGFLVLLLTMISTIQVFRAFRWLYMQ